MKRIDKRWVALPIVVGAALFLTRGGVSSAYPAPQNPSAAWVRALATPAAQVMGMPGLEDFLMLKSYTESRYNPNAGSCANNKACGLYGGREESFQVAGELLHDPRWSTLGASDYAWRVGHKYAMPGQVVTWGAIARGWAFPKLVADVDWSDPRSQDVLDRWNETLDVHGVSHSFTDRAAFPPGARHPGRAAIGAALGLGGVA